MQKRFPSGTVSGETKIIVSGTVSGETKVRMVRQRLLLERKGENHAADSYETSLGISMFRINGFGVILHKSGKSCGITGL